MKQAVLAVAVAATLGTPTLAQGASITGVWNTGSEGGKVQIYRCGDAYCGRIVDAARLRANPDQRDERNSDPRLRNRKLKGLVVYAHGTQDSRDQSAALPSHHL